jgi:hypothetical protein
MLLFRLGVLATSLVVANAASAQSLEAYVTGGGGGWVHNTGSHGSLMVGAGGMEWLPIPHLGLAGEAGVLTSVSGDLAATLGVDARLHFRGTTPPGGWAPYAFAGYSPLRFFALSDQALQFGAGIDYRLSPRRAIRLELRDILRSGGSVTSHYWTARVGLTFR